METLAMQVMQNLGGCTVAVEFPKSSQ